MRLYFENNKGELTFVKEVGKNNYLKEVEAYVAKINPSFKIYYYNICHPMDNATRIDYGSHSTFFWLKE